VELFELFYDLVFVYAISRITLILEEPVGGTFTIPQMAIATICCRWR
jgi:low temperature requirement protein LtrA